MMERRCLLAIAAAGIFSLVSAFSETMIIDRQVDFAEPAEKATCDIQIVAPCLLAFFANFDFEGHYPQSEQTFDDTLHQYVVLNGVAGWSQVQGWMNALYSCSGSKEHFDVCLPWQQFMVNFNTTKEEALAWEVRFRTLEYQVGGGFAVLTKYWYCINWVDQQEEASFQNCSLHFQQEQHDQPNKTCDHVSEYLVCIQRPYALYCNQLVGAFACQYERIVYHVTYPECTSHVALHCQGAPQSAPKLSKLTNARSNSHSKPLRENFAATFHR